MGNRSKGPKHKKSKLEKTKARYQKLYQSWGKVYSPALEADVYFTNRGLDHLAVTKWRTGSEKIERLELLPIARKLIALATTYQDKRFQNYHDYYELSALMGNTKIKVIIEEYKKKYYFYSVCKV